MLHHPKGMQYPETSKFFLNPELKIQEFIQEQENFVVLFNTFDCFLNDIGGM